MKPYFAQYLSGTGPIREGDLYSCPHKGHALEIEGLPLAHAPKMIICQYQQGKVNLCPECYKVQLFLCSNDIKFGKGIYRRGSSVEYGCLSRDTKSERINLFRVDDPDHISKGSVPEKDCFQKIGEISTAAKWVKEYDKFDENEIELWWFDSIVRGNPCLRYTNDTKNMDWFPSFSMVVLAKIMGCCGHFH